MALAERSAAEASELCGTLSGHAPWGAQADAARARVALARGRAEEATTFARAAIEALEAARHEDLNLDVLLPSARILMETGAPEWEEGVRPYVQFSLAMVAQRTMDEDVRVRWLRGPLGSEMAALAGPIEAAATPGGRCRRARRRRHAAVAEHRAGQDERRDRRRARDRRAGRGAAARRAVRDDRRVVARGRHRVRVPGAGPVSAREDR